MVSADEVREWVSSEAYTSLLDLVAKELKVAINHEPVSDILLAHDVKKILAAESSIDELAAIANEKNFCLQYVARKWQIISGTEDLQEGHDDDEPDVVLEKHPFYKNFLNIYLIEIYLLREKPESLEHYLKKIRIPQSKNYAKQLRDVYKAVSETAR